jgi:hypothetical protein
MPILAPACPNEVGAPGGAARLGVVVGEQGAFGRELVDVRGAPGHHAAVIRADVPHANIVAHDEHDVGLRLAKRHARGKGHDERDQKFGQHHLKREIACSHHSPPR